MGNQLKVDGKSLRGCWYNDSNDSDDDVSDAANDNDSDDSHDNDNSDFLVVGGCGCVDFA